MRNFIVRHSLPLYFIWALFIFILCATPGRYIPSINWLDWLSFDKWVHAGIFFVLTSLIWIRAEQKEKSKFWLALMIILNIAYGASLELMQAKLFSERSADIPDFIANTAGCLMVIPFGRKIGSFSRD